MTTASTGKKWWMEKKEFALETSCPVCGIGGDPPRDDLGRFVWVGYKACTKCMAHADALTEEYAALRPCLDCGKKMDRVDGVKYTKKCQACFDKVPKCRGCGFLLATTHMDGTRQKMVCNCNHARTAVGEATHSMAQYRPFVQRNDENADAATLAYRQYRRELQQRAQECNACGCSDEAN